MDARETTLDFKMNWAISYQQVTLILPIKYRGNRPFCLGEQVQINFQDGDGGGHIAFPIGEILAIFDLQVTEKLAFKFRRRGAKWFSKMAAILGYRSNRF